METLSSFDLLKVFLKLTRRKFCIPELQQHAIVSILRTCVVNSIDRKCVFLTYPLFYAFRIKKRLFMMRTSMSSTYQLRPLLQEFLTFSNVYFIFYFISSNKDFTVVSYYPKARVALFVKSIVSLDSMPCCRGKYRL